MEGNESTSHRTKLISAEPSVIIKSCRVCMAQNTNMSHIFDAASNIIDRIEFCTGIQLTKQNGLPSQICEVCLSDLKVAHKFKSNCIESNDVFHKFILSSIKVECDDSFDNFATDDEVKQEQDENVVIKCESPKSKEIKKPIVRKKRGAQKDLQGGQRRMKKLKFRKLFCEPCQIKFQSKKESDEHIRSFHVESLSWVCEICGKLFIHRASLYTHVRSHRPPQFACDNCDYRTWHKHDLAKHIRIHTGIKHFQCEFCTYSFYTSSNLSSHIRRYHEQIKRFSCHMCEMKFYDSTKLNRHIDSHNEVRRFHCDICHSRFTRRCYWKKHLHRQHDIVVPPQRPGKQKVNLIVGEDLINAKTGAQVC